MECGKKEDFNFEYDPDELKRFKRRNLIFDILIYSCLAIITIWLILKTVGVINTPDYIKLIPGYVGVISATLVMVKFGASIGEMKNDIGWLKKGFRRMDNRQGKMAVTLGRVEERLSHVENDVCYLRKCKNYKT